MRNPTRWGSPEVSRLKERKFIGVPPWKLRVCPETLGLIAEFSEHEPN
jgi:hypothetical protein